LCLRARNKIESASIQSCSAASGRAAAELGALGRPWCAESGAAVVRGFGRAHCGALGVHGAHITGSIVLCTVYCFYVEGPGVAG